jgi:uncharacterized membrane protein
MNALHSIGYWFFHLTAAIGHVKRKNDTLQLAINRTLCKHSNSKFQNLLSRNMNLL